jgi:glycosyltransferase involved in cell wall biosynthesis
VYGKWENQTRNIYPFFTASYFENEIEKVEKKPLNKKIQLLYAGAFTKSKQALLSVKTAEELIKKGLDVALNMYGNGAEFKAIKQYIKNANLENQVVLHGNKSKEVLKKAFQEAHFLIFISKSEGWPKVVAEAMFWSCLPISTKVSCVPYMLDYGKRGGLVASELNEIVEKLMCYIENVKVYEKQVFEAKKWSQTVTLEKFELGIKKVVHS